jgi:Fur family ferric uptake transcriptional regulator
VAQTRKSPQRSLVLSLLKNNYSHPTADEIYELARAKDPKISRGTVYRNLNLLAELGEIRKLPMPSGPDHFDCNLESHYHFLCRRCSRVFDTPLAYNEALNQTPDAMPGFQTEWHRLLLVGLCPSCAKAEKDEK